MDGSHRRNWVLRLTAFVVAPALLTGFTAATAAEAASARVTPHAITLPSSLPAGQVGVPYNLGAGASTVLNLLPGDKVKVPSSSLPAGMSVDQATGLLSGTPTQAGSFSLPVTIDQPTPLPDLNLGSLPLTVLPAPVLSLSPTSIPDAVAGTLYTGPSLSVLGDSNPLDVFSFSSSDLPAGMSLDSVTGVLTGTPAVVGQFPFHITAATLGNVLTVTAAYVLNVLPQNSAVSLTPATLKSGVAGVKYTAVVAALPVIPNNLPQYSYTSADLPSWLHLDSTTGEITGRAPASATLVAYPFKVTATVSSLPVASKDYTLTVLGLVGLTPKTIPVAVVKKHYSTKLTSSAGGVFHHFGTLPAGVTLGKAGRLSGTPTRKGIYRFGAYTIGTTQAGFRMYSLAVAPKTTLKALRTVARGHSATLHGVALAGSPVVLYAGRIGHGFKRIASTRATKKGTFAFHRKITRLKHYKAVSNHSPSKVFVIGTNPTLTGKKHVVRNHRVTLRGVARPGSRVTIARARAHHRFVVIGHAIANRKGVYTFRTKVKAAVQRYRSTANRLRSKSLRVRSP